MIHSSRSRAWPAGVALLVGAGSLLGACARKGGGAQPPEASYAEARAVIDRHCIACHSDQPSIPAFPIAPNGFSFDTAEQMRRHAERIRVRSVVERTMPLLNKTGMTDAEREILRSWVDAGAKLP